MVAMRIGDTIEAGESVYQHGAAGGEEVSCPISNGRAREVGNGREFGIDGMMLFIKSVVIGPGCRKSAPKKHTVAPVMAK